MILLYFHALNVNSSDANHSKKEQVTEIQRACSNSPFNEVPYALFAENSRTIPRH
jgi:hypothetical protein